MFFIFVSNKQIKPLKITIMSNAEIRKALNTEFRLDTVKYYIEEINADNHRSYRCSLQLSILRSKLYDLIVKCETSYAIELVEKRQNSVAKALRNLKR